MRDRSIGKKKIAILFTTNHADTVGNANRIVLARYIAGRFDTLFVTNQPQLIRDKISIHQDIREIECKSNQGTLKKVAAYRRIAKLINSLNPTICLIVRTEDSVVSNWLKCPSIQYVHQYGIRTTGNPPFCKRIFRFMTVIMIRSLIMSGMRKSKELFAISCDIVDMLQRHGITNTNLVTHAFPTHDYRHPLIGSEHSILKYLKNSGFFLIAYTGWVTENRGFSIMMEVTRRLVAKGIKLVLVIAGADNAFSKLIEDYKDQNSLHDHIVNYGVIDVSLIPGILHFADACLSLLDGRVPAYRISPPQKVIEYFAAGKAVICNSIETHLSLVSNEHTGLITEYDAESVYQAIDRLYKDSDLLTKLSSNALQESKKYDIDKVYGKLVETMDRIISEREAGKKQ